MYFTFYPHDEIIRGAVGDPWGICFKICIALLLALCMIIFELQQIGFLESSEECVILLQHFCIVIHLLVQRWTPPP